jgi:hypothetical protein
MFFKHKNTNLYKAPPPPALYKFVSGHIFDISFNLLPLVCHGLSPQQEKSHTLPPMLSHATAHRCLCCMLPHPVTPHCHHHACHHHNVPQHATTFVACRRTTSHPAAYAAHATATHCLRTLHPACRTPPPPLCMPPPTTMVVNSSCGSNDGSDSGNNGSSGNGHCGGSNGSSCSGNGSDIKQL